MQFQVWFPITLWYKECSDVHHPHLFWWKNLIFSCNSFCLCDVIRLVILWKFTTAQVDKSTKCRVQNKPFQQVLVYKQFRNRLLPHFKKQTKIKTGIHSFGTSKHRNHIFLSNASFFINWGMQLKVHLCLKCYFGL